MPSTAQDSYDWHVTDARLVILLEQWEYLVLYAASSAIASGVVVNFALHRDTGPRPAAEERIVVATLTMAAFFVITFAIGRMGVGRVSMAPGAMLAAKIGGCLLVSYAAVINMAGRIVLGRFWSDQIRITADHHLVRRWPYSWSRHPLYGSMVLFGIGMSLLMINPIVLAANLAVFLPAMLYRSRHEEALLMQTFGDAYRRYREEVPMLMPLPRTRNTS